MCTAHQEEPNIHIELYIEQVKHIYMLRSIFKQNHILHDETIQMYLCAVRYAFPISIIIHLLGMFAL